MPSANAPQTTNYFIKGAAAKRSAMLFNIGNLIAIVIPVPVGILWLGASIAVYTMLRHHPDPRVGHYTQWAAYRFYGLVGLVVVIATFFSTSLLAWIITWAILAAIIIPWTIYDLVRIHKEDWQDRVIEHAATVEEDTP